MENIAQQVSVASNGASDLKAGLKPLNVSQRVSYAMGDFGCNFSWALINSQLTFFWTDVLMIPAALAGTLMLISKGFDACVDPFVGALADKTRSRWGQYRPWILFCVWPMLLLNVLCFTAVGEAGTFGRTAFAFGIYILAVLAYTCVNIPYSAMPAALTLDPDSRGQASSLRMTLSFASATLISFLILPLIKATGGGNVAKGYMWAVIIFSCVATIPFLWCFFGTKEVVKVPVEKIKFSDCFKTLKGNPFIWICVGLWFMIGIIYGMMNAARMYFFTYVVGNQSGFSFNAMCLNVGVMVGAFTLGFILKSFKNKGSIFALGSLAIFITSTIMLLTKPENGMVSIAYHVLTFIGGMGLGLMIPTVYAMQADVTEWTQLKFRTRAAGFLSAFTSLSFKVALAFSAAIAGWLLGGLGYMPGAEQSQSVLSGMNWLLHGFPAVGALIGVILTRFYKLDRETYLSIVDKLADIEDNK